MFVVNPPYLLHDMLQRELPYLVDVLGHYDEAHFLLEQRAA
jgi:23S rRNA (adenine2030-N6)-methyltransferase